MNKPKQIELQPTVKRPENTVAEQHHAPNWYGRRPSCSADCTNAFASCSAKPACN